MVSAWAMSAAFMVLQLSKALWLVTEFLVATVFGCEASEKLAKTKSRSEQCCADLSSGVFITVSRHMESHCKVSKG